MTDQNPYETPQASLNAQNINQTWDQSHFYSANGRFGRAAYVTHSLALWSVFFLLTVFVGAFTDANSASYLVGLFYIPTLVMGVIFMIRRLHDINWSGWGVLLNFIPIINIVLSLVLLFMQGNAGTNKYGPPRQYVNAHGYIAAILVFVFIAGIIAAIALPSFTNYMQKTP